MSLMRKIFKPGAGQVPAQFIAAFVNGTAVYRGDLVIWDTTAPTSQGSSGVLRGETLGANDFIFVKTDATAANKPGLQAGIVEGKTVGERTSTTAMDNDGIAIVQTWGVHSNIFCVDDTVAAGSLLLTSSTEAGSVADALSTATLVAATDAFTYASLGVVVGFALTADTTFARGTATAEECVTGFIRCNF